MNLETFVGAGVGAPPRVLRHGVDPAAFPLLDRPERDVFTFGACGKQTERKGVAVLVRAFRDEFAPHEPMRLVLNATMTNRWIEEQVPNVEVRSEFLDHAGLLGLLSKRSTPAYCRRAARASDSAVWKRWRPNCR